jgi:osmotically-inducible protein OsmY
MIITHDPTTPVGAPGSLSDTEIQGAVRAELSWSPDVNEAAIGVAVDDGVVTLSGQVETYPARRAAAKAAFRVRGVRSVADAIIVHHPTEWNLSDADVAKAVRSTLTWSSDVPETVLSEVRDHVVTLTGDVEWEYQRAAARRAIERTRGVRLVRDEMTMSDRPSAENASELIRQAIIRNATVDARAVHVEMRGTVAVLTGTVRSSAEWSQAGKAAWSSPHVTHVDNRLAVHSF